VFGAYEVEPVADTYARLACDEFPARKLSKISICDPSTMPARTRAVCDELPVDLPTLFSNYTVLNLGLNPPLLANTGSVVGTVVSRTLPDRLRLTALPSSALVRRPAIPLTTQ
jgi:hypothetical protein